MTLLPILIMIILYTCHHVLANTDSNKITVTTVVNKEENVLFEGESSNPIENPEINQDQIDLMLRTFRKLPGEELLRLGISVDEPVKAGSKSALEIKKAWEKRQIELKEAMGSIVKPAEHMAKIAQVLKNSSIDDYAATDALTELESMLTDVDNARDFHTIGGWPILVNLLQPSFSNNIRMRAAWSIGTSIKNNYDYQLWTLEQSDSQDFTCLELLINLLSSNHDESQRKALYAISSAARGNVDIQEALQSSNSTFITSLFTIAASFSSDSTSSIELVRKAWAFISDMLQERRFIRLDLLEALSSKDSEDALSQISKLLLMGDKFCDSNWVMIAKSTLDILTKSPNVNNTITTIIGNENIELHNNNPLLEVIKSDNPSKNALIHNLLTTLYEVSKQCPSLLTETDLVQLTSPIWSQIGWQGSSSSNDSEFNSTSYFD